MTLPSSMTEATLCYLLRGDPPAEILLAWKKTGVGAGKLTGVGGRIESGEGGREGAVRELREEIGVEAARADLFPCARLAFLFPAKPAWNFRVAVFLLRRWKGEPAGGEEVDPVWYPTARLPFSQMWADDRLWLWRVMNGERLIGEITYAVDNATVARADLEPVDVVPED